MCLLLADVGPIICVCATLIQTQVVSMLPPTNPCKSIVLSITEEFGSPCGLSRLLSQISNQSSVFLIFFIRLSDASRDKYNPRVARYSNSLYETK